jgi:hypothetical protein
MLYCAALRWNRFLPLADVDSCRSPQPGLFADTLTAITWGTIGVAVYSALSPDAYQCAVGRLLAAGAVVAGVALLLLSRSTPGGALAIQRRDVAALLDGRGLAGYQVCYRRYTLHRGRRRCW